MPGSINRRAVWRASESPKPKGRAECYQALYKGFHRRFARCRSTVTRGKEGARRGKGTNTWTMRERPGFREGRRLQRAPQASFHVYKSARLERRKKVCSVVNSRVCVCVCVYI